MTTLISKSLITIHLQTTKLILSTVDYKLYTLTSFEVSKQKQSFKLIRNVNKHHTEQWY